MIPYFVMLCIEGIPIFYLELAIGQRLRKGAIGVWNQVSPYLAGIGISSAVVSFNVALYYNTIIAWCLFYFAQSFQSELPWSECPNVYFNNGSYVPEPECTVSGLILQYHKLLSKHSNELCSLPPVDCLRSISYNMKIFLGAVLFYFTSHLHILLLYLLL